MTGAQRARRAAGHHWDRLVSTQREVVTALRHHEGLKKDAAKELGISQQSLSNRTQSAGAREYAAGMDAWRAVLRRHEPRVAR